MQAQPLANTTLKVSRLGLGCMGMSDFYGATDDTHSLKVLDAALDLGVNFFDTADMYGFGRNEELLGQWLKHQSREQVVIATKFGLVRNSSDSYERRIDNTPEYIQQACEASLKRLGIDCIDLYYCHRRNPATPIEDMMQALVDLIQAGKIKAIGLSEVSADTLYRAHAVYPVAAVQSEYSLWTRNPEQGVLPACQALGTRLIAYSPLGRAFLTASVRPEQLAENDFRRINPRFQAEAFAHNQSLVDQLVQFAHSKNATPAQIALAWLLTKTHVIPIPGTKRLSYLQQNMAALDVSLSHEEIQGLEQLFDPKAIQGERYTQAGMVGIE